MKPTEELKSEHRVIERMLDIVSKACDRVESGGGAEQELFAGAAGFFREFADKCHHSKEEKLLFERMIDRGMPRESGPIAVMLSEHDAGRALVRKMAELSRGDLGDTAKAELVEAAREYVAMLSAHIDKEDNVLYPMADGLLTKSDLKSLEEGFEKVERDVMGPGVHEKYHKMIEAWEKKYR